MPTSSARLLRAVGPLALVLAAAGRAHAGDVKKADELFREALSLADAGNWDLACPRFRQSYAADPSVGALLNMASCSERGGQLRLAKEQYTEAFLLNEKSSRVERREAVRVQVKQAIATLDVRLPKIKVTTAPPNATVTIDGVPLEPLPEGMQVDAGAHTVRVEAAGFTAAERRVEVVEKQRFAVQIELTPAAGSSPTPPPIAPPGEPPPAPRPPDRPEAASGLPALVPGIVVTSLGVALAGTGGALLGLAAGHASDIRDLCGEQAAPPRCHGTLDDAARATELSDSGAPLEIAGGVLLGAGGAAIITGVILLATRASTPGSQPAVALTPTVGPEELGWTLSARF